MSLIVIEGLDGSGKSTQVEMLKSYLSRKNIEFCYLHFPRTEGNIYAELVARFLRGELGDINHVNPYLVALIYAGDRNDAKNLLNQWLSEDKMIILDRYVYSNIAYQCAKFSTLEEIEAMKKWIIDTEFGYFSLPKPDLNLYLDVPFEFTRRSLAKHREGADRNYLNDKGDIHENDILFQERVRNIYLSLCDEPSFEALDCSDGHESMLSPDIIFDKILYLLKNKNLIL